MAEETTTDETTDDTTSTDTTTDDLGDAGKRAIAAERARAKTAERAAAAANRALQKAQADLEEARNAGASEAEQAIAKAKKEGFEEGRRETLSPANKRLVRAEIKAAAASQMDPALAAKLLADEDFDVDDDGNVDEKAIAKAIKDLLEDHPNLAANGDGKFRGSGDGGARRTATGADDMNARLRQAAGRA